MLRTARAGPHRTLIHCTGPHSFRFVGQNPFTGVGQLRFFQQNGDTVVEANTTDLTGGAELRIVVDPLFTPQAGDFVL